MKWYRLTENKCPECNKTLAGFSKDFIQCKCGFGISTKKFGKIVGEILERKGRRLNLDGSNVDNQTALNNL